MLDDTRITDLGKFEGESEATRYLYERSLDGSAEEEYAHESFGWFALFLRSPDEPLRDPAYIMQEHDNGFVTSRGYASEALAREAWNGLVADLSEGDDDA